MFDVRCIIENTEPAKPGKAWISNYRQNWLLWFIYTLNNIYEHDLIIIQ